jgi:hypothetical protein
MRAQSPHPTPDLDALTVAALGILAYCCAFIVHEELGHGSACLLVGGRAVQLNAVFFQCTEERLSSAGMRWLAAGGSIVEVVFAAVALALVRTMGFRGPRLQYFLWLFSVVSLLAVFGYPLFSGIGGVGDWAVIINGWHPEWLYRAGLVVVGALLYFGLMPRLMMRTLDPFLGRDIAQRKSRARRLTLLPYLVGCTTVVLAGILNPEGFQIVLLSAAAGSLGGTSLLAWYPQVSSGVPLPGSPAIPLGIQRSMGWVIAAGIMLVIFVFVLGPGVKFRV